RDVPIGVRGGACEPRGHMDDAGAALPGLGHPLEGDGVRLGHGGPLDDDEVSVGEVLLGLCGAATTERGSQTGNRGGVSYAALVLDLDRARGGEDRKSVV